MIAFDLYVNGETLCRAGIGEFGVLSGHVTWAVRAPAAEGEVRGTEPGDDDMLLDVSLGGLDSATNEHLRWRSKRLAVGDEVRFVVVEASEVDPPTKRKPGRPRAGGWRKEVLPHLKKK